MTIIKTVLCLLNFLSIKKNVYILYKKISNKFWSDTYKDNFHVIYMYKHKL